jgi:hypothetical protein
MARRRTTKPAPRTHADTRDPAPGETTPATPVTGVASGALGTAANLEDTQLWSLDDLQPPEPVLTPEPPLAPDFPRERARAVEPVRATRGAAKRDRRRTGFLAALGVAIVALAALLAMRDGLPGGATRGAGDAAGAFPSLPAISTEAPAATNAPEVGAGGNGHGNGGGNGNGNGHGGGGDH